MAVEQIVYVTKLDSKDVFRLESKDEFTIEREGSISSSEASIVEPEQETWKATRRVKAIVATLALCLFVVALDSTILISALPVSLAFPLITITTSPYISFADH